MRLSRLQRQHYAYLGLSVLLLLGSLACTPVLKRTPEAEFQEVLKRYSAGDLIGAYPLAQDGYTRTRPGDPSHTAFAVELARIELYRGEKREALRLLSEPLPPELTLQLKLRHRAATALALLSNGQGAEARRTLQDAEESLEHGQPSAELESVRGEIQRKAGDLKGAAEKFQSALHAAEASGDLYPQMTMLMNLGVVQTQREQFDEALDNLHRADPLAQQLGNNLVLEKLLGNQGFARVGLGNFAEAQKNFEGARKMAADVGARTDAVRWQINEGAVQFQRGDFSGAKEAYRQGLSQAQGLHDEEQIADIHAATGSLLLAQSPAEAKSHLAAAADMYRRLGNALSSLEVELLQATDEARNDKPSLATAELTRIDQSTAATPSIRWRAERELANAAARSGDAEPANAWFRQAVQNFQQQQCSVEDVEAKLRFQEVGVDIYKDYVEHLIHTRKIDEALVVYDEGLANLLRECKDKSGRAGAGRRPVSVPNPRQLARQLQATLLVYYPLPEVTYLWAVSRDRTSFYHLPGMNEINGLVRRHEALVKSSKGDPLKQADGAQGDGAGQRLYNVLIGPAESQIKRGDRIYILADRGLSRLNFDTLITPGERPHYWLEDVTIINTASLRLLSASQEHPARQRSESILVLGDPAYPKGSNIDPLPHAAEEVRRVAAHYPAGRRTVLTGASATAAAYESHEPGAQATIHVIAHAVANPTAPLESYFMLAGSSDKLYAHDVLKYPLKANLVVLSTCNSSGTEQIAGEGVVGLAWAFERAGSRNVIGALWEVSDAAAPELMDHMYADITSGVPPAQALRNAKLAALHSNKYSLPFYWAPFQLYSNSGEGRAR